MITERCNLNCKYCFANEFVNKRNSTDINLEQLETILDFILGDGTEKQIGLIGGEPLCHPKFDKILDVIIKDVRVEKIIIYTNGILIDRYIKKLKNEKIYLLINCNDLSNDVNLNKKFLNSLDIAFHNLQGHLNLGSNFYKIDYNYNYILELVEKYNCKKLRVSISVPNDEDYNYTPLKYFKDIKPNIFKFFKELKKRDTVPYFDCNMFPPCLVSVKEMNEFNEFGIFNPFSIIKNHETVCKPVIDIRPDMSVVRCFGLSKYTKTNIKDFASIKDLRNYYLRTFDAFAVNCYSDELCKSCYKHKTIKCSGGCMIYKIDNILKYKNMVIDNE